MLLALDIGNSTISLGVFNENRWIHRWRIQSDTKKLKDEYLLLLSGFFTEYSLNREDIKETVISSVVPELTSTFKDTLKNLTNTSPLIIDHTVESGISISIGNPAEVGSDILANAAAANEAYKGNSIVVDFGTALTFTAIRKQGELLGVSIAPGLKTASEALALHTAQLPHVPLEAPPHVIGTNTIHSIQSGIVLGYAGLADSIIIRMKKALGDPTTVIATGGLAETIAKHVTYIDEINPWLTLDGLKVIAEHN